jgi:hypothetical protein
MKCAIKCNIFCGYACMHAGALWLYDGRNHGSIRVSVWTIAKIV